MMPLKKILDIPGWMNEAELRKLMELCKGKRVLEIGSYKGRSSCAIANTATDLVCFDTWKAGADGQTQNGDTLAEFSRNTKGFANITAIYAGNPVVGESPFDVLFIDGMHTHEAVKADITKYSGAMVTDGLFIFHDYETGWPGVMQAVDESFKGKPATMEGGSLAWIGKDKLK